VGETRLVGPGQDLVADGSSPRFSTLLVSGLACRYKLLDQGRRQICSFQIGGDVVDLYSFVLRRMDHAIGCITQCTAAMIPHANLERLLERYPHLAKVLWRDTLIDASLFREWMINIGRRTSEQRLAHLVCEMFFRMRAVGLAEGKTFAFAVTQTDLADCFGLSLVHTNRTIKKLQADGLVSLERGAVSVESWDRLIEFVEFDPAYLHQNETEGV
jgi:CRP-like cAMP-binding protein